MKIIDESINRLIADLEDWARWSMCYRLRIGFPSRSIGLSSGFASQTFDEMCEQADSTRCRVLDTMIDDLSPAQRQAIHRRYLHAVYRFPRENYAEMLAQAHEELLKGGAGRGLW